jgi:hypothetical protein
LKSLRISEEAIDNIYLALKDKAKKEDMWYNTFGD